MKNENLEKAKIQHQISEPFNLADSSFVRSDDRMHSYKLAPPPPMVSSKIL
jgi:hypothetical protein